MDKRVLIIYGQDTISYKSINMLGGIKKYNCVAAVDAIQSELPRNSRNFTSGVM